ncbi:MAG: hypothetical protein KDL87_05765 [Verrucomicrobiae bacterium]|nr:hypothetical protein [Verrucomicrobiae bacterium]
MNPPIRLILRSVLAALLALVVAQEASFAQTTIRSRLNDRNRERPAPTAEPTPAPAAESAPAEAPMATPAPVSPPNLAQNDTSKLPSALQSGKVGELAETVRGKVAPQLEGQSTEELIQRAQQTISSIFFS